LLTFVAIHPDHHPRDSAECKPTEGRLVGKEEVDVQVPLQDDEAHAWKGREGGREGGRGGGGGQENVFGGSREIWVSF